LSDGWMIALLMARKVRAPRDTVPGNSRRGQP